MLAVLLDFFYFFFDSIFSIVYAAGEGKRDLIFYNILDLQGFSNQRNFINSFSLSKKGVYCIYFQISPQYQAFLSKSLSLEWVGRTLSEYNNLFYSLGIFQPDYPLTRGYRNIVQEAFSYKGQNFSRNGIFLSSNKPRIFYYFSNLPTRNYFLYSSDTSWFSHSIYLNNVVYKPKSGIDYFGKSVKQLYIQRMNGFTETAGIASRRGLRGKINKGMLFRYFDFYFKYYDLTPKDISNYRARFFFSKELSFYRFRIPRNVYLGVSKMEKFLTNQVLYSLVYEKIPLQFGFRALEFYGYSVRNDLKSEKGLFFQLVNNGFFSNLFRQREPGIFLRGFFDKMIYDFFYTENHFYRPSNFNHYSEIVRAKDYLYGLNRYYRDYHGKVRLSFSSPSTFDAVQVDFFIDKVQKDKSLLQLRRMTGNFYDKMKPYCKFFPNYEIYLKDYYSKNIYAQVENLWNLFVLDNLRSKVEFDSDGDVIKGWPGLPDYTYEDLNYLPDFDSEPHVILFFAWDEEMLGEFYMKVHLLFDWVDSGLVDNPFYLDEQQMVELIDLAVNEEDNIYFPEYGALADYHYLFEEAGNPLLEHGYELIMEDRALSQLITYKMPFSVSVYMQHTVSDYDVALDSKYDLFLYENVIEAEGLISLDFYKEFLDYKEVASYIRNRDFFFIFFDDAQFEMLAAISLKEANAYFAESMILAELPSSYTTEDWDYPVSPERLSVDLSIVSTDLDVLPSPDTLFEDRISVEEEEFFEPVPVFQLDPSYFDVLEDLSLDIYLFLSEFSSGLFFLEYSDYMNLEADFEDGYVTYEISFSFVDLEGYSNYSSHNDDSSSDDEDDSLSIQFDFNEIQDLILEIMVDFERDEIPYIKENFIFNEGELSVLEDTLFEALEELLEVSDDFYYFYSLYEEEQFYNEFFEFQDSDFENFGELKLVEFGDIMYIDEKERVYFFTDYIEIEDMSLTEDRGELNDFNIDLNKFYLEDEQILYHEEFFELIENSNPDFLALDIEILENSEGIDVAEQVIFSRDLILNNSVFFESTLLLDDFNLLDCANSDLIDYYILYDENIIYSIFLDLNDERTVFLNFEALLFNLPYLDEDDLILRDSYLFSNGENFYDFYYDRRLFLDKVPFDFDDILTTTFFSNFYFIFGFDLKLLDKFVYPLELSNVILAEYTFYINSDDKFFPSSLVESIDLQDVNVLEFNMLYFDFLFELEEEELSEDELSLFISQDMNLIDNAEEDFIYTESFTTIDISYDFIIDKYLSIIKLDSLIFSRDDYYKNNFYLDGEELDLGESFTSFVFFEEMLDDYLRPDLFEFFVAEESDDSEYDSFYEWLANKMKVSLIKEKGLTFVEEDRKVVLVEEQEFEFFEDSSLDESFFEDTDYFYLLEEPFFELKIFNNFMGEEPIIPYPYDILNTNDLTILLEDKDSFFIDLDLIHYFPDKIITTPYLHFFNMHLYQELDYVYTNGLDLDILLTEFDYQPFSEFSEYNSFFIESYGSQYDSSISSDYSSHYVSALKDVNFWFLENDENFLNLYSELNEVGSDLIFSVYEAELFELVFNGYDFFSRDLSVVSLEVNENDRISINKILSDTSSSSSNSNSVDLDLIDEEFSFFEFYDKGKLDEFVWEISDLGFSISNSSSSETSSVLSIYSQSSKSSSESSYYDLSLELSLYSSSILSENSLLELESEVESFYTSELSIISTVTESFSYYEDFLDIEIDTITYLDIFSDTLSDEVSYSDSSTSIESNVSSNSYFFYIDFGVIIDRNSFFVEDEEFFDNISFLNESYFFYENFEVLSSFTSSENDELSVNTDSNLDFSKEIVQVNSNTFTYYDIDNNDIYNNFSNMEGVESSIEPGEDIERVNNIVFLKQPNYNILLTDNILDISIENDDSYYSSESVSYGSTTYLIMELESFEFQSVSTSSSSNFYEEESETFLNFYTDYLFTIGYGEEFFNLFDEETLNFFSDDQFDFSQSSYSSFSEYSINSEGSFSIVESLLNLSDSEYGSYFESEESRQEKEDDSYTEMLQDINKSVESKEDMVTRWDYLNSNSILLLEEEELIGEEKSPIDSFYVPEPASEDPELPKKEEKVIEVIKFESYDDIEEFSFSFPTEDRFNKDVKESSQGISKGYNEGTLDTLLSHIRESRKETYSNLQSAFKSVEDDIKNDRFEEFSDFEVGKSNYEVSIEDVNDLIGQDIENDLNKSLLDSLQKDLLKQEGFSNNSSTQSSDSLNLNYNDSISSDSDYEFLDVFTFENMFDFPFDDIDPKEKISVDDSLVFSEIYENEQLLSNIDSDSEFSFSSEESYSSSSKSELYLNQEEEEPFDFPNSAREFHVSINYEKGDFLAFDKIYERVYSISERSSLKSSNSDMEISSQISVEKEFVNDLYDDLELKLDYALEFLIDDNSFIENEEALINNKGDNQPPLSTKQIDKLDSMVEKEMREQGFDEEEIADYYEAVRDEDQLAFHSYVEKNFQIYEDLLENDDSNNELFEDNLFRFFLYTFDVRLETFDTIDSDLLSNLSSDSFSNISSSSSYDSANPFFNVFEEENFLSREISLEIIDFDDFISFYMIHNFSSNSYVLGDVYDNLIYEFGLEEEAERYYEQQRQNKKEYYEQQWRNKKDNMFKNYGIHSVVLNSTPSQSSLRGFKITRYPVFNFTDSDSKSNNNDK